MLEHRGVLLALVAVVAVCWRVCSADTRDACPYPGDAAALKAMDIARAEYDKYCRAITGKAPPPASFALDHSLDAKYDEYRIVSVNDGIVFRGANRRALLYAVYDFLSRRGGCRWFWDADIVPKKATIDVSGLDVHEKSQHEYRGIRYFAHRGLTRFQAEHWGFDDWKREIDWCVKKRVNVMMLRIGQDDIFQRAFPDVCAYPDPAKPLPATGKGFSNRSLFWPLQFRGRLREQIVAYAQDRGLIVPEDSGTMTHWYSRTPIDFVQKMKPDFISEKGAAYNDGKGTGLVWDIRQQKWIDAYWQLTEAALKTYDNGDDTLIHTMGVGERKFSEDHDENIRVKLAIDKKVVDEAIRRHPDTRVLYPGWDFYYQWRGEDVKKFVSMLDPAKTIIWQYTSDSYDPGRSNPLEWGIVGKFPYTFGIFLTYESGLDIRADYDLIRARESASKNDPFCVGYILWPESSHTDLLAAEYFAANGWRIDAVTTEERISTFCRDRYGENAATFEPIWQAVVPISTNVLQETWRNNYGSSLVRIMGDKWNYANNDPKRWPAFERKLFSKVPAMFRALADVDWNGDIVRRDTIDLARTVGDRLTLAAERNMMAAYFRWKAGSASAGADFERAVGEAKACAALMGHVLSLHTDYSLNDSLERLNAVEPVRNPDFGQVLLENAVNTYCASHQVEPALHLYPQLIDHVAAEIRSRMASGSKEPLDAKGVQSLVEAFQRRPLVSLKGDTERTAANYRRTMLDFADTAERMLRESAGEGEARALSLTSATAEIVVSADAPKTVRFAAKELKTFLDKSLGADIPVVDAPTKGKSQVVLGMNGWAAEAGISTNALVRDAFVMKTSGSRIYLVGRDDATVSPERAMSGSVWASMYERATLFGVYEFLERYAGVRFYFPGELGTVVPRLDAVNVPPVDIVVAPDWKVRRTSTAGIWHEGSDRQNLKAPVRNLQRLRRRAETQYQPFCHGQIKSHLAERFHKTHPEYFIMGPDGKRDTEIERKFSKQLCHSSAVWEEIYQDSKHYLMGDPASVRGVITRTGNFGYEYSFQGRKYVDVMPQDGMRQCHCEKCQAAYAKDDAANYATELIWGNVKRAAERLKSEGVDGHLTMMAYRPYRRVPKFDLPDNVLVMVAERGPWSIRVPENLKRDNAEIAAWRNKLGHSVCTWTYANKYGKTKLPDVPYSTPRAIAAYYKSCAKDIYGSYMESETERAYTAFLPHYVFFKIAWNTQTDVDALLEEHYRLMYGAAAGDISAIADLYERKWLDEFLGKPVDTPIGPAWSPASEEDVWYKIYSPEVLADLERRFAAALGKVPPGSLEARRIDLMRRETLEPMKKAGRSYVASKEAVKGWMHRLGRENILGLSPSAGKNGGVATNSVRTTARVWEEGGALKFEIVCQELKMKSRLARKYANDTTSIWRDDNIEIMINPTGDRDVFYHFIINSAGTLADFKHVRHLRRGGSDVSWNAGATVAVTDMADSWKIELVIPLAALEGLDAERFPAEIVRQRRLKGGVEEVFRWSPYSRSNLDIVNYGYLLRK